MRRVEPIFSEYFAHPLAPVLTITLAVLVILLLHRWMAGISPSALQSKLGADGIGPFWFAIGACFWAVLFLMLFAGLVWTIFGIVTAAIPAQAQGDEVWAWRFSVLKLASLTAVLGAVVALPFTLVRLGFTRAQNHTAEEALYNDKMNAAVADLHAQRQVTEWYTDEDSQKHAANGWQDDITRRNGAIDTLRGLATERPELLERIDQMLSVYLRELTREYKPAPVPKDANPEGLREWASNLEPVRSDMNNAVVALSKLPRTKEQMIANDLPDLAEVNMQGFRLSGVALPKANLRQAQLQGANLVEAELQGADLGWAKLQGADLVEAKLQGADLTGAELQGANLIGAKLQGADLTGAELQGADLGWAKLQGADLVGAKLQCANLSTAMLRGVDLSSAQLQEANLSSAQLQGANLSSAQLQGANLFAAQLQGADLTAAEFDSSTRLTRASLRGAALLFADISKVPQLAEHLAHLFGDATVKLPEGVERPERFTIEYDNRASYDTAWRAFQRSIGQDPDNPE